MGILYPVLSAVVLFQKCSAWSPLNTQALETLDKFIHNLLTCPFSWWLTNSKRFFFLIFIMWTQMEKYNDYQVNLFSLGYTETLHIHTTMLYSFLPGALMSENEWCEWEYILVCDSRHVGQVIWKICSSMTMCSVIKDCFAFCCFQWQKQGQMPKDKKPSLMYPGCKGLRGLERCFCCDK